ncbi:hypothetical protein [Micromonospora sp. NPDC126480]|uniref:hypothetical protein n=1 Tax=Micromonospora sp. NPDC126480 TaxID=3155312 RepID=UPI003328C9E3
MVAGARRRSGWRSPVSMRCRTWYWLNPVIKRMFVIVVSIIDVVENYAGRDGRVDFSRVPGTELMAFGEEVRRYCDAAVAAPAREATYLGGWPSANPFYVESSDLILTSLLYARHVVVRDPISDWFSADQYYLERPMAGRPGYLSEDGRANVAETRAFLGNAVPGLLALKPLVERGIVSIVPAAALHRCEDAQVRDLIAAIMEQITDPYAVTSRFSPADVATADNLRGTFVFAGGDRETQLRAAIEHGVRYFAREFMFASQTGATYCAPFPFEEFLCDRVGAGLAPAEARVAQLLIASDVPIFHGLNAKVVAAVHDDDNFGEFRRQLYETYGELPAAPPQERTTYLRDREDATLRPLVDAARRDADRGALSRIGVRYGGDAFALGAGIVAETMFPTGGAAAVATTTIIEMVKRKLEAGQNQTSATVWTTLARHGRRAARELPARDQPAIPGPDQPGDRNWGIPAEAGMNVVVSSGSMLVDFVPGGPSVDGNASTYQEGPYRPCACASGRKYKFCCAGVA